MACVRSFFFFFFNDTATTEIYTLSLHDALPIYDDLVKAAPEIKKVAPQMQIPIGVGDRKSTRLNSSHGYISYAVFCLKKKKIKPHLSIHPLNISRAPPPSTPISPCASLS